jgi:hypothetical protein
VFLELSGKGLGLFPLEGPFPGAIMSKTRYSSLRIATEYPSFLKSPNPKEPSIIGSDQIHISFLSKSVVRFHTELGIEVSRLKSCRRGDMFHFSHAFLCPEIKRGNIPIEEAIKD